MQSRIPVLILASILLVTLSCRRTTSGSLASARLRAEVTAATDSGDMDAARRIVDAAFRTAEQTRDSDLWASANVQHAILDYYQNRPDSLRLSATAAINWLEKSPRNSERLFNLSKAWQCLSACHDKFTYRPDSSLYCMHRAVQAIENDPDHRTELAAAYGNLANALRFSGHPDSAALYYTRAIEIADSLLLPAQGRIALYNGLAGTFTDVRDFHHSAQWWQKSAELLPQLNVYDRFTTLSGLGTDLYYREDYPASEKANLQILQLLDTLPSAHWETNFTRLNLADIWIKTDPKGKTELIKAYLDSAEHYFTHISPNTSVLSYTATQRINLATALGNFTQADSVIRCAPSGPDIRPEQKLARSLALSQYYAKAQRYDSAYKYDSEYHLLFDSIRSQAMQAQVALLTARYDRDSRILELRAQQRSAQSRILRLWLIIIAAVALIFLIGIITITYRHRARRREERLMNRIIALRHENLRSRITPHFIYNALNHELAAASPEEASRIRALVGLIRHQQKVASSLTVSLDEELEFVGNYITVERENIRGPFTFRVEIDPGVNQSAFHTLRIPSMALQIMVENAIKHSFLILTPETPKILTVNISESAPYLLLAVVNNTPPDTPPDTRSQGQGLKIITQTLALLNEHRTVPYLFNITTLPGHKCQAKLSIPLNANTPPQ